jgi:hypothetical protein
LTNVQGQLCLALLALPEGITAKTTVVSEAQCHFKAYSWGLTVLLKHPPKANF